MSTLTPPKSGGGGELVVLGLRRSHDFHQVRKPLLIDIPALHQRQGLIAPRLGEEKGADLVEEATEACSSAERFESTHGSVPLFTDPVIKI